MSGASGSKNAVGQTAADVAALALLSQNQTVTMTQYTQYVLPLDGYIFWLRTGMTIDVPCSVHVTIDKRQNEDETLSNNRVMVSTATEIQEFNEVAPTKIWIGEFKGRKFAFSKNDSNYSPPVGLWFYIGEAVPPALLSQLIDVGSQLSPDTLIVSNSLPLWLSLKNYNPVWLVPPNPGITLYPSFAVPANISPPYGSVHIDPNQTIALQPVPNLGPVRPIGRKVLGTVSGTTLDSTHYQLVSDRVRVTLYGATNQVAADFFDLVYRYSYDLDLMGIMSDPTTIRDEKRVHTELGILAMKKTLDFRVSYYQSRVNATARQLLLEATVTIIPTVSI